MFIVSVHRQMSRVSSKVNRDDTVLATWMSTVLIRGTSSGIHMTCMTPSHSWGHHAPTHSGSIVPCPAMVLLPHPAWPWDHRDQRTTKTFSREWPDTRFLFPSQAHLGRCTAPWCISLKMMSPLAVMWRTQVIAAPREEDSRIFVLSLHFHTNWLCVGN